MRRTRRNHGSALAFLDVMACGLGVAILLFLIVKHNIGSSEAESSQHETEENRVELLAQLNEQKDQLGRELAFAEQQNRLRREQSNQLSEIEAKQTILADLNRQIESEKARKTKLEQEIVSTQPRRSTDVFEDSHLGEEKYLLGLEVKGSHIAILIDRSASMTDDLLIEIISRKIRSDSEKKEGPKWKRTLRTVKWLLNRVPEKSSVIAVVFNDRARILNGGHWATGRDGNALQGIVDEVNQLVPTGATNLEAALRTLKTVSPPPSDIYVITDGLPTKSLSSPILLSKCRNKAAVVSGECRRAYFQRSLSSAAPSKGRKVNVILLPLEGDPEAAPEYWAWTAKTGGLLLIPSANWP